MVEVEFKNDLLSKGEIMTRTASKDVARVVSEQLVLPFCTPDEEKKRRHADPPIFKTFRKLQKEINQEALHKILYLELLQKILDQHANSSSSIVSASPTSPYFLDGQKPPLRHASLILRMIKNQSFPTIRLKPHSSEQILMIFKNLWEKAFQISCLKTSQIPSIVLEHSQRFISLGTQLEHTFHSSQVADVELFQSLDTQSGLVELFEAAWEFGKEYYTMCLERL